MSADPLGEGFLIVKSIKLPRLKKVNLQSVQSGKGDYVGRETLYNFVGRETLYNYGGREILYNYVSNTQAAEVT